MKKHVLYWLAGVSTAAIVLAAPFYGVVEAGEDKPGRIAAPTVFQAAGPNLASIQATVDQFRAALGAVNNGNVPGPLASGRREINWDGGGSTATAIVPTPFDGFLVTRGARFTTNGNGFVQATVAGMATTFGNASYDGIFQPFSAARLFSAIHSTVTDVRFFIPGGGEVEATTTGFGAVFTDVDRQNGSSAAGRGALIEYYGVDGKVLFTSFVPAAPGNAGLSFYGIVLADASIAAVRIRSGSSAPGPDDSWKRDIVLMDDFIFGEPR